MKKLLLSLALAASTISPAVAQAQSGVAQIINVARGNGTDVEVVNARIQICREIAKDYRPETVDNAVAWMRRNGFTEVAINQTQLICIAYFQGLIDMRNNTTNTY